MCVTKFTQKPFQSPNPSSPLHPTSMKQSRINNHSLCWLVSLLHSYHTNEDLQVRADLISTFLHMKCVLRLCHTPSNLNLNCSFRLFVPPFCCSFHHFSGNEAGIVRKLSHSTECWKSSSRIASRHWALTHPSASSPNVLLFVSQTRLTPTETSKSTLMCADAPRHACCFTCWFLHIPLTAVVWWCLDQHHLSKQPNSHVFSLLKDITAVTDRSRDWTCDSSQPLKRCVYLRQHRLQSSNVPCGFHYTFNWQSSLLFKYENLFS